MMRPENPAEAMVWKTILWTWPFYGLGALYVVGPVLAWLIAGLAVLSLYLGPAIRSDLRTTGPIPPVVWAWMIGMLVRHRRGSGASHDDPVMVWRMVGWRFCFRRPSSPTTSR